MRVSEKKSPVQSELQNTGAACYPRHHRASDSRRQSEQSRDVYFAALGQHFFFMAKGETIHTENSLKYGPRDAGVLLQAGGWTPIADWTDHNELFSVILAREGAA